MKRHKIIVEYLKDIDNITEELNRIKESYKSDYHVYADVTIQPFGCDKCKNRKTITWTTRGERICEGYWEQDSHWFKYYCELLQEDISKETIEKCPL